MPRDLKPHRSTKGRTRQKLNKRLAVETARAVREIKRAMPANPARHEWLVRHVERQGGRCAYCGIPMFMSPQRGKAGCRATLDHIVALTHGGADSESNTVAACEACNSTKSDMKESLFRSSSFCRARKKLAETLADSPAVKPTVPHRPRAKFTVVVKKRPRPR